jgi:hypothetical protein
MENKTIQDKLSFFALAGTRDTFFEKRRVTKRRGQKSAPGVIGNIGVNEGLLSKNAIQLSLF